MIGAEVIKIPNLTSSLLKLCQEKVNCIVYGEV